MLIIVVKPATQVRKTYEALYISVAWKRGQNQPVLICTLSYPCARRSEPTGRLRLMITTVFIMESTQQNADL